MYMYIYKQHEHILFFFIILCLYLQLHTFKKILFAGIHCVAQKVSWYLRMFHDIELLFNTKMYASVSVFN